MAAKIEDDLQHSIAFKEVFIPVDSRDFSTTRRCGVILCLERNLKMFACKLSAVVNMWLHWSRET